MDTLAQLERQLNNADRALGDFGGIKHCQGGMFSLRVSSLGHQPTITFWRVRRPWNETWLAHDNTRASLPNVGHPRGNIDMNDSIEATRRDSGSIDVVVGMSNVAVVAATHLTSDFTQNNRQIQLVGLLMRVNPPTHELAGHLVDFGPASIKLRVHIGEDLEQIVVGNKSIYVDAAILAIEAVSKMTPEVVS